MTYVVLPSILKNIFFLKININNNYIEGNMFSRKLKFAIKTSKNSKPIILSKGSKICFARQVCICECGLKMEMRYLEDGSELGDFEGPIYCVKCPVCNEVWELQDAITEQNCHLEKETKTLIAP
jgi:hypothetical protein